MDKGKIILEFKPIALIYIILILVVILKLSYEYGKSNAINENHKTVKIVS